MKHKFNSMGRVAIALVLALSLGLVMAGPAAVMGQGSSNYAEYTLQEYDDGVAEWSTDQALSGKYSVLLNAGTSGGGAAGRIWVELDEEDAIPIADFTGASYFVWEPTGTEHGGEFPYVTAHPYGDPYINIYLDLDEDGTYDECLEGLGSVAVPASDPPPATHPTPTAETWVQMEEGYGFYDFDDGLGQGTWTSAHEVGTLAEWKAHLATAYPDAQVVGVKITFGFWADDVTEGVYVDDVTISGVTYDLQPPIFLDALYYQVDDTVTVTVINPDANTDAAVQESVVVLAESDLPVPPHSSELGLRETGVDTGVFTETFTLVGTTAGTGELLVTQGATITVTYAVLTVDDTAAVDSAAPVVTITDPAVDVDFVSGAAVSIIATVTETNPDTAVLTIGGTEVEATYEAGIVTYTWDTTDETGEPLVAVWPDGAYTIEVVATDLAGLVGSDSISVTVDNTLPVIADQEATPPVVEPAVEHTIVFTASVTDDNVDTVTINLGSIGGSAAEPMLDDGLLSDVEEDDGIYTAEITTTLTEAGSPYTLTVTAIDLAELSATADITLVVSSDTVPPVITDLDITYEYGNSAQPGEPVTIFATVTDDVEMGTVTAVCDVVTVGEPKAPITIDLLDGGVTPDVEADDGIYTGTATVDSDAVWGNYPVTITATDAKGNELIDETLILAVRIGATGIPLELEAGWNLISLPLIPVDADITVVISATTLLSEDVSSVGIVWGYDPATGEFSFYMPGTGGDLTEMEDGVGYWVFMEEADTLTITGREWPVPPEVPPVYSVVEGWNLIGVKSISPILYNLYLGNLYDLEVEEFSVIWGYSAVAGRYFSVYPIEDEPLLFQGHGYWLWMKVDGTIVPPQ